jgi:EAL domain-containing protein (putative c-di-GMP-specific phosphodiesterase class I)
MSDITLAGAVDFSFAFQPIVDIDKGAVYSYEALVRGLNNEPAFQVINRYAGNQMYAFDAACRAKAIEVAARLGMSGHLNLNMVPCEVLDLGVSLYSTIEAAHRCLFPLEHIVIESTEVEVIDDHVNFALLLNEFRRVGMRFAIDDFGAGYSGLLLLSEFQPDMVKLDMSLVRGIRSNHPRQAIVRAILQVCAELGIDFIVEGVETGDELSWFADQGAHLFQGYLFAKPLFEGLPSCPGCGPEPDWLGAEPEISGGRLWHSF